MAESAHKVAIMNMQKKTGKDELKRMNTCGISTENENSQKSQIWN